MKSAAVFIALALAACAQPPKPSSPTYTERVILLPARDGGASALVVTRGGGAQTLEKPYEALEISGRKERRAMVSTSEVDQRYGGVLAVQPERPFSYTLYFDTGTTDLTPQSKVLLDEVRQRIRAFPAAQVTVIGHTDRVGTKEANDALSLKRALAVRDMLVRIGIAPAAIEAVGRGEREPLVATADGKSEARNRRVEVKLR